MTTLDAVDAKIARARTELRLLSTEITAFCLERVRLISREPLGDTDERWVYRGDTAKTPIDWSIRAGQVAYNLRSALDHLVWQLASSHGQCAGKHNGKECPGTGNAFPIHDCHSSSRFERQLCGVTPAAKAYIMDVQPYRAMQYGCVPYAESVGKDLSLLHEVCNIDKHRHLVVANAHWTGIRHLNKNNFIPADQLGNRQIVELEHGNVLVDRILGFPEYEQLEFIVDAFFDDRDWRRVTNRVLPVSETLARWITSVEMVVGHLRNMPPH